MNFVRNEIRTGLLVIVTLGILAGVLAYLAAPGTLRKMTYYQVYFDDAGGIQPGSPVMLAGRRVGEVLRLNSPVPEVERPRPNLEAIVVVGVHEHSRLFNDTKAYMLQYGLLGEEVINFAGGSESSGRATMSTKFIGERQLGLNEAAPKLVEMLDPVAKSAVQALEAIQTTAQQFTALTEEGGDLSEALANFRTASDNLAQASGTGGALQQTLENLHQMTGNDSPLAETLRNAKQFTGSLANNKDIDVSLQNFRKASRNLNTALTGINGVVRGVTPNLKKTAHNAAQFSDTIKHQPWRLIWPTTKKYPDDGPPAVAEKAKPRRISALPGSGKRDP